MNYGFYADVFFLTNAYLDFLAVYAVGEILLQKKKTLRYLLCCALSSLAGCILFLYIPNFDVYALCVHFMINPIMTAACFYPAKKEVCIKAYCLTYFVILLLGGSVEWLYVTVAKRRFYELCLLLSAVPVIAFLFILRWRRKNVHCFYQVTIWNGEKSVELPALLDTGNRLTDPYVNAPVHIVSKGVFEALGGNGAFPVRLIPFSSVGCRHGMVEAFTVERALVNGDGAVHEASPAVLAWAQDDLFCGRPYRMILHSSVAESFIQKEERAGEGAGQLRVNCKK